MTDLAISADGTTLYVANTLGHTIAAITIAGDANTLSGVLAVGGLATDVKIAGRWGLVSGHSTNSVLNARESGHGLPKIVNGVAIRNTGQPLGYTPVMSDATRATTFDDLGSELERVRHDHQSLCLPVCRLRAGSIDHRRAWPGRGPRGSRACTGNHSRQRPRAEDYNIHEPGVVAEITVDNEGPFTRLFNDYFFKPFAPPQDLGGRQNISSRNTKHLRSFWDGVPRWLHHGAAHTIREVLLTPDSPLLAPGERGFNFRTVRADHSRVTAFDFLGGPAVRLPTEVPITFADSLDDGSCTRLAGDGMGPICVSLDSPFVKRPAVTRRSTGVHIPRAGWKSISSARGTWRRSSSAAKSTRCSRRAAFG